MGGEGREYLIAMTIALALAAVEAIAVVASSNRRDNSEKIHKEK